MTLDDPVDELLLVARKMREATDDVFIPAITWQPEAGNPVVAHLTELTGDTKKDLDTAFHALRDLTGPPLWFAVTLDCFARDGEPDEDEVEAASLEEAFLGGDMRVVEQMVTILMTPANGELIMIRQIYRHTPVDGWEWEPPQIVESPTDSVTTAVRMFH